MPCRAGQEVEGARVARGDAGTRVTRMGPRMGLGRPALPLPALAKSTKHREGSHTCERQRYGIAEPIHSCHYVIGTGHGLCNHYVLTLVAYRSAVQQKLTGAPADTG